MEAVISAAIPKIRCEEKLDGFRDQLRFDGNLTTEAQQAIALRRIEIQRANPRKKSGRR